MPTDTQGSAATGDPGGQGSAGTGGNVTPTTSDTANGGGAPGGQTGNTGSPGGADISALVARMDKTDAELAKARAEAAKYRTKLRTLAVDDEVGDAGKTGASSVPNEITESIRKLREGRIRDQLTLAATTASAKYPDAVVRLVDVSSVADDEGNVKNPDKVMADLRKSYPDLFKPVVDGGADGGAGSGNPANPGDMNDVIRQGFRRLRGSG